MNKKLAVVMALSLSLNVLLAGIVLGRVVHFWQGNEGWWNESAAVATLPADKQVLFHSTMDKARQSNAETRKEIQKVREETIQILITEPFDEAAYQAKVKQMQGLRHQQSDTMADAIKSLAKQLTKQERSIFTEMLRHPPHHGDEPKGDVVHTPAEPAK
jgi:uncharacterized membrane protein